MKSFIPGDTLLGLLFGHSRSARRKSRGGYSPSERLDERILLSAVVGPELPGTQQGTASSDKIWVINKKAVHVGENGVVYVGTGDQANDGKPDRIELTTAGSYDFGGRGATQVWINGELAAVIPTGTKCRIQIDGSNDADQIDASKAAIGVTLIANGGRGNDTIIGSSGNDIIRGDDGDDVISGGNGNDVLLGGAGNDLIQGEGGNDTLDGASGSDLLEGGAGNDVLRAGNGTFGFETSRNTLFGGDGNDTLESDASGYDVLYGEAGNDVLTANGSAMLHGGTGDDDLKSVDRAFMTLNLKSDVDQTISRIQRSVVLNGGEGNDTLRSAYDLSSGKLMGANETMIGGNGGDTFVTQFSTTIRDYHPSDRIESPLRVTPSLPFELEAIGRAVDSPYELVRE